MITITPAHARARLKLSQSDLADRLGISRRQWQYYESGEKPAEPWLIFALCWLLSGKRVIKLKPDQDQQRRDNTEQPQDCG